ncbi:MAG: M1 family metallopeptidase [Candidatus Saccharibacteria bacterium]
MQTVPRLINTFNPNHYKISLLINRTERIFKGTVQIKGLSRIDEKNITLHCKDLIIESIKIDGINTDYSLGENDSLCISKPNTKTLENIVSINFTGKITDSMHGMYTCHYEHDGIKKELIATQFESHHAREVFPCIDEPEAKATFDVTLTTENNVTVLGNMPIIYQVSKDDVMTTTFETTPVMSSYLLAWVVGDLHKKTALTKSGVEVNIWATPAQKSDSLDFALDIATRSIDFFDEYFDTPYPLSKCDHVALPDFSSGAMENWGLITYREIALLVDPETTSIATKHYVATVIAHELSHQWFGNLVTMKWWNDLWLNESFASLVEYNAVDAIEPDWNVWLDFASYESVVALKRDRLKGVQSVQTDVKHPDEISTLFDGAIVYAKGARLLKMLQHYIGNEAFQSGLKNYFKKYAYKNTEADDLWSILAKECDKDIMSFMSTWIKQPGYPVLHVSRDNNTISLSQERVSNFSNIKSDSLWPITLNSNYSELPDIFDVKSADFSVSETKPIRFNIGNDAHFITHYEDEILLQIISILKSGGLLPIDRLQLLNEQNILASVGIISNDKLIPLLEAFSDESNEAVWDIIGMTIGELKKFVENDNEAELKLRTLAGLIACKQFERLGWTQIDGEPETDTKLRVTVIGLMVYSENNEVIDEAIKIFNSTILEKLDSELRPILISNIVRQQDNDDIFYSLIDIYKTTSSSELKQDINIGLTASKNPIKIKYLLDMIKDTSVVRPQDSSRWIAYLIRNKFARVQTWQWVRENWSWINEAFAGDKSYDDFPRYISMALSTNEQLNEFSDFFLPLKSDPALTRVVEIGVGEISDRVNLINRDGKLVRDRLLNL